MAEEQLDNISTEQSVGSSTKVYMQRYYQDNKDAITKYKQEYRQNNKELLAIKRKEYYQSNKEAIISKSKGYYLNNKESFAIRNKKHCQSNKEIVTKYMQEYYKNNKEYFTIRHKEYYKNNKEKLMSYQRGYVQTLVGKAVRTNTAHKRRSITKNGDVTTQQLLDLQSNAKVCYWCNCSLKKVKVHIDHYEPLSKDGEHTLSNLVVSCGTCNMKKNAKDPHIFANSIGKLL